MMNKEAFRQYGGSTPYFSLKDTKTYARVTSVYDGDTIHVVIPIFNTFYKFPVRLSGIDTCEIKSKNAENKEKALRARNRLFELVTNKPLDASLKTKKDLDKYLESDVFLLWLHCLEFDKYGRLLANVYKSAEDSTTSFSDMLINEKLAYSYDGGTKLTEDDQLKY